MQERKLSLGAAIKVARQNQQLTQTELSEELDISSRHLQAIENENKAPSYELLSKILRLTSGMLKFQDFTSFT